MKRIISEAELRIALGLHASITDHQQALLHLAHRDAEGAVKKVLHYDPCQFEAVEYYPRISREEGVDYVWDTNRTHALLRPPRGVAESESLQLARLPVRAVSRVEINRAARHGDAAGAWDGASVESWTAGTDYWAEWDEQTVCGTGMLLAATSWPSEPGTVRVTYTAGYSQKELAGEADESSSSDVNGEITRARVDASPIKLATLKVALKAFHSYLVYTKGAMGFAGGPKQSENFGSYSYALAAAGGNLTGMVVQIPPEVAESLEPFVHWGLYRL